MKKLLLLLCLMAFIKIINAQEESVSDDFKPTKHITGYASTLMEYVDLGIWKKDHKNFAMGLSEAAVLVTYNPLKKLEFKSTIVYNHFIRDINSIFVEANATYSFSRAFKISGGKYLTPLSPVNQYFYAPMNPALSLPMVVSHHFILPQSISGLQIKGEFGNDFSVGYNITYGNCRTSGHPFTGMLGIQGAEDLAPIRTYEDMSSLVYQLGGTARIYTNYNDIIKVGFNYFDGRYSTQAVNSITSTGLASKLIPAQRHTTGVDLQLNMGGLKANAEYWLGSQKTIDEPNQIKNDYSAYYGELIYEIGIFSPYVRYDYVEDMKTTIYLSYPNSRLYSAQTKTNCIAGGIAVRPIYEVLLKFEYRQIKNEYIYSDVNTAACTSVGLDPNNPLGIVEPDYNYFGASLVISF